MSFSVTVTDNDTGQVILHADADSAADALARALVCKREQQIYNPRKPETLHLFGASWPISIYPKLIRMGCQTHTPAAWAHMTQYDFHKMSLTAWLDWQQWGDLILEMAKRQQERYEQMG